MAHDCGITASLKRRQKTAFRIAERQYGITQKAIELETGLCRTSIGEYARGETAISGPALMKLASWPEFPVECLSIMFAGTGRVVRDEGGGSHQDYAEHCIDFSAAYAEARRDDSECGPDIGPGEDRKLSAKRRA